MFQLTLVTPGKKHFEDLKIKEVLIPGYHGEMNILPGHAPLMTTMSPGVLSYKTEDASDFENIAISWGYCEVTPEGITVLAETAENPADIDVKRAEEAKANAEKNLQRSDITAEDVEKFQWKLRRAQMRIDAARVHGKAQSKTKNS